MKSHLTRSVFLLLTWPAFVFAWPASTEDEGALADDDTADDDTADEVLRTEDMASQIAESIDASFEFEGFGDLDELMTLAELWDDPHADDPYGADTAPMGGVEIEEADGPAVVQGVPIGGHTHGRLRHGIDFPADDPRFNVLAPWRAYSAQVTIDRLSDAVDQVEALFPGTPALTVGDVSRKGGGHLSPHMSHQNGLDVDIGPYWKDGEVHPLRSMHPGQMDMDRTWALLEALVADESVQYIILDYRLQQAFYEYAEELPWMDEAYLELLFQYPRGPRHHEGIIRHWWGHYSHFHVRFHCPDEFADTCRD
jgi:hypothetical protein